MVPATKPDVTLGVSPCREEQTVASDDAIDGDFFGEINAGQMGVSCRSFPHGPTGLSLIMRVDGQTGRHEIAKRSTPRAKCMDLRRRGTRGHAVSEHDEDEDPSPAPRQLLGAREGAGGFQSCCSNLRG